ncbi:MAG: pentapeptide repeat-containing protein [Microcystaceae cyanobacterium]
MLILITFLSFLSKLNGLVFVFAGALALFACYIGYRTLKEETRDVWLRKIAIACAAIGGTSFYNATLTDANFTGATLKNTNFNQAHLIRTCFKNTVNLNLAKAKNTLLANPTVRDLLINPSSGNNIDLHKANLRGANLESANLQQANLKQADISKATLQYANLKDANLTEINAISTNFDHVLLMGACLEGWKIDPNTNLDNV